nr:type III PLP-dependent enzyme [Micromonospora sp. DSM 115978]
MAEPAPPPAAVRRALAAAGRPVCAYVYHRRTLRSTVARLRAGLPAGVTLLYAVKANGHPEVVRELAALTDGLEVASGGELALAATAGAGEVVFGGPAKTDAELRAAVAAGALVHVESGHELRRLDLVARAAGARVPVAVRVNRAGRRLAGSHAMAGAATPFGVDEEQVPAVAAVAAASPGVRLVGFHLHEVSNSLDAVAHAGFVTEAVRWSVAAAARLGFALRYVNVGGGLGVDYTGAGRFDVAAFGVGLRAAVAALPAGARLVLEPGRFLVADAGWYAAQVLDLKRVHGRWFAVLRGGTHHFRLPAAWGHSHPFTVLPVADWEYPFDRPQVVDVDVDAVGELCTPRDVLARGRRVARLRVGDVLVFGRAGAYGWDISHHEFLRHPHPLLLVC